MILIIINILKCAFNLYILLILYFITVVNGINSTKPIISVSGANAFKTQTINLHCTGIAPKKHS